MTEQKKAKGSSSKKPVANSANATIVGSIPKSKMDAVRSGSKILPATPTGAGALVEHGARTVIQKAPVREGSPIISLSCSNSALIENICLFSEALRKIGIFNVDLVSSSLYDDMEAALTTLRDMPAQFEATDGSVASVLQYSCSLLSRATNLFTMFIEGDDERGCGDDGTDECDRIEFSVERVLIGRRLSSLFEGARFNSSACRKKLDDISIALFGQEVEVDGIALGASDTVSLHYMLESTYTSIENLLSVVQTLTYRINENF